MPSVPDDRLAEGGWTLVADTTETLFRFAAVRIEGHTLVYEDADRRAAIDRATDADLDGPWRFFFATRLAFRPSLTPGIGLVAIRPTVIAEARHAFVEDLEARGFRAIERRRVERFRTDAGDRARLATYTTRRDVAWNDHERTLDVEAWLGVWIHDGSFRIAGGAYPICGFDALLAALGVEYDVDPIADREELLELIRAVE